MNLKGQPGAILNENLIIACSKNAIQVLELQKEGKKKQQLKNFLEVINWNLESLLPKMFNYLLKVEYNGSNFVGWQSQKTVSQYKMR